MTLLAVAGSAVAVLALAATGVPVLGDVGQGLLVLDTLSAAASLLAALLVFGRFRRSALLSDVALVWAFFALAMGNLLAAYVEPPERVKLVAGALSSLAVLVAAGARERSVGWRRAGHALVIVAGLLVPLFAIAALELVSNEATGSARDAILLVTAIGFGVGAIGFTVQTDRDDDALEKWLAVGCVLACASRLLYTMGVAPDNATIHPADVGRFLFATCLVIGAVLEIRSYWFGVAVLEERRRIARELHDGMAQELATIVNETRRGRVSTADTDAIAWYRISRAAERALDESRRAIHALISPLDQPLDEAVVATAEDVAAREGAEVSFDVEPVQVASELREAVVRIVREAVGNAAKHGNAGLISVELKSVGGTSLLLRVTDDGRGFTPASSARPGRVGLTSMQERAKAFGGSLTVTSAPGAGTAIELVMPCR